MRKWPRCCPSSQAIPMLHQGHPASITLSQVQIACLLANAFFCTFPHRNTTSPRGEYHRFPTINFNRWGSASQKGQFCWIEFCQILKRVPMRSYPARSLFGNWSERKKEKLRAIMHYFKVVTDESETMRKLFPCVWSFQWMCVTSSLSHSPHPRHEARWAGDFRETLPPRHRYAKMEKVTFSAVSFFFCL